MKTIVRNFLYVLRRFKMATILNVAGLSVAFAAFLIIMMQVNYERTFDRCHPLADRIFRVDRVLEVNDPYSAVLPRAFANAVFASSPHIKASSIQNLLWAQGDTYITVGKDMDKRGFREYFALCYPDIVSIFGFSMIEGDAKCLDDPEKLLIPESMAHRLFGDESAVGKQIYTENNVWGKGHNTTFTVGAVYKDFPKNTQLDNVIYTAMDKAQENDWQSQNFLGYILLDTPESYKAVEDNFNHTFDFEKYEGMSKDTYLRLVPLTDTYYFPGQLNDIVKTGNPDTVKVLFFIALLVIVVAGINFTNFSTSLTPMRIKSINTQKVLGSSVAGLRIALVVEAVGISIISYGVALFIVWVLNDSQLLSFIEADTTPGHYVALLLQLFGVAVGVGLVAGIYPAWYMTSFPPALVLKGSFGLSPTGRTLRTALIGFQYVVSIGLIVGSCFIQLQNNYMRTYKLGFDKDQIAIVEINRRMYSQSKEVYINKLKEISGVEDVAFANHIMGGTDSYASYGMTYNNNPEFYTYIINVSPNFLRVMNIPIVDGRDFTESDARQDSTLTFIYNQSVQQKQHMEAGHYMDNNWNGRNYVAGFIGNIKISSFRQSSDDVAFVVVPNQSLRVSYIRLKAGTDVQEAVKGIRGVLTEIDPSYPFDIQFYDTLFNQLYHKEEYLKKMISLFSLLAIVISIVGVFGLVIFETQYRRKEIGIRKVHGATVGEILAMFNKAYLRIVVVCFIIASPIAYYGVYKWLEGFSDKTPVYWWVFVLAFGIVAAITLLTVTFQNWRAANENPVNSIKSE